MLRTQHQDSTALATMQYALSVTARLAESVGATGGLTNLETARSAVGVLEQILKSLYAQERPLAYAAVQRRRLGRQRRRR